MKITVFSSKRFERDFLDAHPDLLKSDPPLELTFLPVRLGPATAAAAAGSDAACIFVNDVADAATLKKLHEGGVRLLLLRCAGFNQVDLAAAREIGLHVLRVPAYSPYAVAEFAVALLLTVARKTHRAYNRTRDGNFALHGLMGFDVHGKTVGVVGTGKIGRLFAGTLLAFGARVVAHDLYRHPDMKERGVEYMGLDELLRVSDIVSLHCPLLPSTRHMIDADAVKKMKRGVVLVNTSRGELVDMDALIDGLHDGTIGACGMDVIEGESGLFFEDRSGEILEDRRISTLLSFPNVLITPHVAFCTDTALNNIWETTVANALEFTEKREMDGAQFANEVVAEAPQR